MYYIIRNILQFHNSNLKNIHLLGLAYTQDVKKYGYNVILHSFDSELNVLERDGFEIDLIAGQPALKGSLVAISADNLGANSLMGFVESFSAHDYCRHCLISKINVNEVVCESQTVIRIISNYNKHLSMFKNQNIVQGIKLPSILNDLSIFQFLNAPSVDA